MARAYRYATEQAGPRLPELEAYSMIQNFGAQAVFGRILTIPEMRSMALANRIVGAVRARKGSEDWAEWAERNPDDKQLLDLAVKAAYGS